MIISMHRYKGIHEVANIFNAISLYVGYTNYLEIIN